MLLFRTQKLLLTLLRFNHLTTCESREALLKLLAGVLAVHMYLGLLVFLDHADLLLANCTTSHHRCILILRGQSATSISNTGLNIGLLLRCPQVFL